MALKFFWRCEGTTLDATHDFTGGDTTAALASGAAINTAAAKFGTNGLDVPGSADTATFVVSAADLISTADGSMGCWFRITTFGAAAGILGAFNGAETRHNISIYLAGTDGAGTREVELRYRQHLGADLSLTTTAADLALGTWYFVLARWNDAANDRKLEVYNDAGSLITSVEDLSTNMDQPTGINQLVVGDFSGIACDLHIDSVFVGDTYAEPIEDFLNITSYTEYGAGPPPITDGPKLLAVRSNIRLN